MKSLKDLLRHKPTPRPIYVVSGLPRSGTSLMMMMLEAAGIEPLTDHERSADDDNPRGYYEFERVKRLKEGDFEWLKGAEGKAVKVISALLQHLPSNYHYKVIFMRRTMPEILASQKKMLINRGENTDKVPDKEMAAYFEKHLAQIDDWLDGQPNISTLMVNYNLLVNEPKHKYNKSRNLLGVK